MVRLAIGMPANVCITSHLPRRRTGESWLPICLTAPRGVHRLQPHAAAASGNRSAQSCMQPHAAPSMLRGIGPSTHALPAHRVGAFQHASHRAHATTTWLVEPRGHAYEYGAGILPAPLHPWGPGLRASGPTHSRKTRQLRHGTHQGPAWGGCPASGTTLMTQCHQVHCAGTTCAVTMVCRSPHRRVHMTYCAGTSYGRPYAHSTTCMQTCLRRMMHGPANEWKHQ
jgi:hypothetical protein